MSGYNIDFSIHLWHFIGWEKRLPGMCVLPSSSGTSCPGLSLAPESRISAQHSVPPKPHPVRTCDTDRGPGTECTLEWWRTRIWSRALLLVTLAMPLFPSSGTPHRVFPSSMGRPVVSPERLLLRIPQRNGDTHLVHSSYHICVQFRWCKS